ncbi:MAG TPA: hypothetical protein VI999_01695 [Thermoplasmata archaeon]|nr:hypothetical protein [Thermoplasmata archaeon]
MPEAGSIWARRFIAAALMQGGLMFVVTVFLLYLDLASLLRLPGNAITSPAAVVAGGGAGNWFTAGYLGYLLVLVVGSGLSALFYHYIEVVMENPYEGTAAYLAWAHLLIGNLVLGAGLGLMMYGGYVGGAAGVSELIGGGGHNAQYVHDVILGPLEPWISVLLLIGALGPLLGGLGYGLRFQERA